VSSDPRPAPESRGGLRVAFVIQRYGAGVTGGSESLARAVAERLSPQHQITVLTTCARDYLTWRNELPAGVERVSGVEVVRFPVEEERDLDAFNRHSEPLYRRSCSREEELDWLRRQGPYVPRLVRHLESVHDDFDAVVFFTYLYYPTPYGASRSHRSAPCSSPPPTTSRPCASRSTRTSALGRGRSGS
jgi:hypothetical protein